jgi:hypothetical protein
MSKIKFDDEEQQPKKAGHADYTKNLWWLEDFIKKVKPEWPLGLNMKLTDASSQGGDVYPKAILTISFTRHYQDYGANTSVVIILHELHHVFKGKVESNYNFYKNLALKNQKDGMFDFRDLKPEPKINFEDLPF